MKYLLFIFLFFLSLPGIYAQVVVEGTVRDEANAPVTDAIVIVKEKSSNDLLGYDIADSGGKFRFSLEEGKDTLEIRVSLLGYGSQMRFIERKNQQLSFRLSSKDIQIREVMIKPPAIRMSNDTLSYNLKEFASPQDRYIGDILQKLPGVEVSSNGGISYNGKPINKFYIEGMDLLQEKYSIATNNIPVEAVTGIQVIENHQHIKSLQDISFTDQAAINLKLKNSKMTKPVGNVELSGGWVPFLWNVKLFSMQVAKNRQTMLVYKTANTGYDLTKDLTEHTLWLDNNVPYLPTDLLSPGNEDTPSLSENRYLFNRTNIVSLNNLWRLNDNSQLRVNADYINDERTQDIQRRNEYYFPSSDSTLIIDEYNSLKNYNNRANLTLNYTNNAPKSYINDNLKLSGKWVTQPSGISGTKNVDQRFYMPLLYVQNELGLVLRHNKKVFRFDSFARYSIQPQQLQVTPDTLSPDNNGESLIQNVSRSIFYTTNETSFGYHINRKSTLSLGLNLNADIQGLESDMNFDPTGKDFLTNHLRWNRFDYVATPSYNYMGQKLKMNIEVRLTLSDLYVNDRLSGIKDHYDYLLIDPALSMRYEINNFWDTNLSGKYKNDIGDIFDLNRGLILTNYRMLQEGSGILEKRNTQFYSWRIGYRNPFQSAFFNLMVSYRSIRSNLLNERTFVSVFSITTPTALTNRRNIWSFNGYFGKYVTSIKTTFSLNVGYNRMDFEQQQQGAMVPVVSHIINVMPRVETKLGEWGNLKYTGTLINNRVVYSGESNDALNQTTQNLSLFIFLNKKWQIRLHGEYLYNEITRDVSTDLFFGDIGVRYKLKSVEFSFDWTNILNRKNYSYTIFDGINTYYTNYNLRPTNILLSVDFKF